MIYLNFNIYNPFRVKHILPRFLFSLHKRITKYRKLHISLGRFTPYKLFLFELDIRFRGRDHQGPSLVIGVFGYDLEISVPTSRHWDYDTNDWFPPFEKATMVE